MSQEERGQIYAVSTQLQVGMLMFLSVRLEVG